MTDFYPAMDAWPQLAIELSVGWMLYFTVLQ